MSQRGRSGIAHCVAFPYENVVFCMSVRNFAVFSYMFAELVRFLRNSG